MAKVEDVTRRIYIAGDGKEFLVRDEAQAYEIKRLIDEILAREGVCRGGEWDATMIRNFLIENDQEIIRALDPYYTED